MNQYCYSAAPHPFIATAMDVPAQMNSTQKRELQEKMIKDAFFPGGDDLLNFGEEDDDLMLAELAQAELPQLTRGVKIYKGEPLRKN